jgi:hypothetical protein
LLKQLSNESNLATLPPKEQRMNRRRRPQSSASFLAPAFAKVVVRLDQDPIEALLQQQERQLATN